MVGMSEGVELAGPHARPLPFASIQTLVQAGPEPPSSLSIEAHPFDEIERRSIRVRAMTARTLADPGANGHGQPPPELRSRLQPCLRGVARSAGQEPCMLVVAKVAE